MCLLLGLLIAVLASGAGQTAFAQEPDTATAADDSSDSDDERKQRTAASALATLAGIILTGLGSIFIILLLGAWTRRMAKARGQARQDTADDSDSGGAHSSPQATDEGKA